MVLDASVWVSVLSRADARHAETRAWQDRYIASGGWIEAPVLVLSEVSGAMARIFGNAEAARLAVNVVRRSPVLTLVELDLTLATLSARLAGELRLRGADAVYVALALREGVPLLTWDREQRERAAAVVDTRVPA